MDSATDLGDREGVFLNSCVTIVVGGGGRGSSGRGSVVQQVPILVIQKVPSELHPKVRNH